MYVCMYACMHLCMHIMYVALSVIALSYQLVG
jgi:hypothetical protein